jgi:catalase
MWNAKGERFWVKFHFKTQQGHEHYTNEESEHIIGKTRESYQEDLINAVDEGTYPKWTLYIQVMPEEEAGNQVYNPFDLTKVWPHKDYPLIEVGELEMHTVPGNYFQMIENAAYSPSNVVPGIGFSPDKMLQARIFSYADAHRYRLGTHYEALPANAPKNAKVNHYHKDGAMRFFTNDFDNPDAYYEPNQHSGPQAQVENPEPPLRIDGDADRYNQEEADIDYVQPRALYEMFSDEQKARLYKNYAAAIGPCSDGVKERWYAVLEKVHPNYAAGVKKAVESLDTDVNTVPVTEDTPLKDK